MDAPKPIKSVWGDKIFPKTVHVDQAVIRFPNGVESGNWQTRPTDDTREYILATEHARIVAEKDAEIAALKTERDRWHADANLMLGFADLAYAAGATPSSSDLIAARDRVVAAIRALAEKG